MKRRHFLFTVGAFCSATAHAQTPESDNEDQGRAPLPRLSRVQGLRFTSPELMAVREALRPSATALQPLGRGRAHGYEQHGYRSRAGLTPEVLALAMQRTWGHPAAMDFVWYEQADPLSREADVAALALCAEGPDARPLVEREAVQVHVAAVLANTRTRPSLMLFATRCGWGDEPGALVRGIAIIDPATRELYWTYLLESWSGP